MKHPLLFFRSLIKSFPAAALWVALAAPAAQLETNPAPAAANVGPVATNATVAEIPFIQSVFVMPSKPDEGKDPFFPRSMRPYGSVPVLKTNQPVVVVQIDLQLKAISGPPEHHLAMVNNRTFDTGEEGEVTTAAGRVRIRCVEIRPDSVLVQILSSGEQRVLHLRAGL
jgi:hypothetical protein